MVRGSNTTPNLNSTVRMVDRADFLPVWYNVIMGKFRASCHPTKGSLQSLKETSLIINLTVLRS